MHYGPPKGPPDSPLVRVTREAEDSRPRSPLVRWACGLAGLLFGGVLLLLAATLFFGSRAEAERGPRVAKADELRQLQDPASLSDPWVAYTSPKVIDLHYRVQLTRKRNSTVKYLLFQVQDRWLLAQVPPDFTGNRVEGRLEVWNGPQYNIVSRHVHSLSPAVANRLLPYQMDAQYDYGINSRFMTILAGFVALFGSLIGWAGLKTVRGEREPAGVDWSMRGYQ